MCRHREVTTLGPLTFPQKAGSFDERRVSAGVCPFWRTDDSTRGQETATKGSVMKSREDNSDLPPQPPHASPGVQPADPDRNMRLQWTETPPGAFVGNLSSRKTGDVSWCSKIIKRGSVSLQVTSELAAQQERPDSWS